MKLYMFRTVLLSIFRSLLTVHSAMIYVIEVCRQSFEQDQDAPSWSCSNGCLQTSMTYIIAECTVNKLLTMDRQTVRNMKNFVTK